MNHPITHTSCYPSVDQADVFRSHKPQPPALQQQEDLRLPIGLIKPPGLPLAMEQVYTALDDIRSITKDAPAMGITSAEVGAIWGKLDIARINLNVFLHTHDWSQFKL
jgi:hypothetical protein